MSDTVNASTVRSLRRKYPTLLAERVVTAGLRAWYPFCDDYHHHGDDDEGHRVTEKYSSWCRTDGSQPVSARDLAHELQEHGAKASKVNSGSTRVWRGIWCDA